jgi:hypothetical protein
VHVDPVRVLEHDVGDAAHLGHGLALGTQGDEEPRDLDRGGLAGHDLGHCPFTGLLGAEVLPDAGVAVKRSGQVALGRIGEGHDAQPTATRVRAEGSHGLGDDDRVERV